MRIDKQDLDLSKYCRDGGGVLEDNQEMDPSEGPVDGSGGLGDEIVESEGEEGNENESEPKKARSRPSVKKAAFVQCTMCQMWCHAGCTGRETIDDCGIDFVCPKCKKGGEGEDDIILENVREDEEEKDKNKDESRKREREKKTKKTKMTT